MKQGLKPDEIKGIMNKKLIPEKIHWLFKTQRRVQVDTETNCIDCIHNEVCDRKMSIRCANYWFGTNTEKDCFSCTNHYARWDKKPIPCFYCLYFIDKSLLSD